MTLEIKVPTLGESVSEATVSRWLRKSGEAVKANEVVVELETDKVSMEIYSDVAGVLEIKAPEGSDVKPGDILAVIKEGAAATTSSPSAPKAATPAQAPVAAATKPVAPAASGPTSGPAARKLMAENNTDATQIAGTGKDGRVTKGDVLASASKITSSPSVEPVASSQKAAASPATPVFVPQTVGGERREKMSRLRQRIAERLVEAQHTAAILTTFNEIDMTASMEMRKRYKDAFEKRHGLKLGFMSIFGRACILALKEFEKVNAFIDGTDVVYHDYVNLGIAVGTDRGLVVPVLKHADQMSIAQLEASIAKIAKSARDGALTPDDLSGGTFSISNGGVYGSLMSTPILNPPQSAILGMHKIQDRPVVVDGQMVIRPMMYVALSYDHRMIDGEQAVSFLIRVKQYVEDPARLVLEA